jgi:hypothetical protein
MSGFLANLVARGLGEAPVIQPRLPSWFESLPLAEGAVVSETAVAQPAPEPTTACADQGPPGPARPNLVQVAPAEATTEKPPSPPTLPAPPTTILLREREDAGPPPKSIAGERLNPSVVVPRPEPSRATSSPSTIGEASREKVVSEPTIGRQVPQFVVQPEVKAVPPEPPAKPLTPGAAEATTGPIIQVRIGRIDVRAVQAPEQARSSLPAAKLRPTLTLEEYLKRRNEEER